MSAEFQNVVSLGIGGVLISLVGYSIFRLINAWTVIASTEKDSADDAKERAVVLQERLTEEIAKRVALEVEVNFLRAEVHELRKRLEEVTREMRELE